MVADDFFFGSRRIRNVAVNVSLLSLSFFLAAISSKMRSLLSKTFKKRTLDPYVSGAPIPSFDDDRFILLYYYNTKIYKYLHNFYLLSRIFCHL